MFVLKQKFLVVVFAVLAFGIAGPLVSPARVRAQTFSNANTITFSGDTYTYNASESPPGFYINPRSVASNLQECDSFINSFGTVTNNQVTAVLHTFEVIGGRGGAFCGEENPPQNITISNAGVAADTIADIPAQDPGGEETTVPTCASTGGALAWIACPVSELLVNAIQGLAHWLSNLLQVQPLEVGSPTYNVWVSMRNVALALFVVASLVLIFGQTLGIDAYTIKRTIPRLGVAAIGIMLSFYVSAFLIDLFNVLGRGMYELMVGGLGGIDIETTTGSIVAEWLAVIGGVGALWIGALSQGSFAFFIAILLPVVLAFLTGFVVIVARQVLILMLVLVSPLAIAAWILPSTDKWFKRWWNFFTTLLMMYPMIMVLLAAGTIFATLVTGTNGGVGSITEANFINQLIALLALAITVGMIPFTLKASSSLLGRIAGVAGNPNFGPIDRLRKASQSSADYHRGKKQQDKLAALQNGKNWRGRAVSGEKGAGFMARGRHAMYRLTTGTGPGMGGQYSDELRAEKQRSAMSKSDRMEQYGAQAAEQAKKLAEFKIEMAIKDIQVKGREGEDSALNRLVSIIKDDSGQYDDNAKAAAFRKVDLFRGETETNDILNHLGQTGQVELAQRFRNETYSNMKDWAPQHARGAYEPALDPATGAALINPATGRPSYEWKPDYGAFTQMRPDDFARNVPVDTIKSVMSTGNTDHVVVMASQLARARPETRDPASVQLLKGAAAFGPDVADKLRATPSPRNPKKTLFDELIGM